MKARTIFAPYYLVEGGFKSILGMNNSTQFPLDVNPTMYSEDGIGMPMPTIRIEPHQPMQVDLSTWVAQLGRSFTKGSLQLDFTSVSNGLVAKVLVINEQEDLILDVLFHARTEFRSSNLEAIWWSPGRHAEMKVYVTNTKDTALRASLTVTDTEGNAVKRLPVPLHARQVREINLRDIIAREPAGVGGISISHEGKNGAVMAEGFIMDRAKGFSANLGFQDPAMFGDTSLHGAGAFLPSGFTGTLLLRNTSGESLTVNSVLRRGTHEQQLGKLTLSPGASQRMAVRSNLPDVEGYGTGVEIRHSGSPGNLIGHWYSADASGNMVVETPLRNPGPTTPGSGSHPFMLTDDFQSVLFVKNPGSEKASFVGVIFYGREQYMLGARFVEPSETVAIDIRKLRDERVPDVFGNPLPADLESGQFQWLRRSGPRMVGRIMILSASKGMAINMSCPQCPCQPGESYYDVNPLFVLGPLGGEIQLTSTQSDVSCDFYVNTYPIDPSWLLWSSTNATVAPVNSSGNVACQSSGNSTICGGNDVSVQVEQEPEDCENGDCYVECNTEDHHEEDCSEVQVVSINLSCPSQVTRGQSASCSVSVDNAGQASIEYNNWKFVGGGATVNCSGGNQESSWQGTMVVSGTVSVDVKVGTTTYPRSRSITVNDRTGFAFAAVSPVKQSNPFVQGNCSINVPTSPAAGNNLGFSCLDQRFSFQSIQGASGPNQGFWYVQSVSNSFSLPTSYNWIIAGYLDDPGSEFAQKQCGNYDPSTNSGYISHSQLKSNTVEHESGSTTGHYAQYESTQDAATNNIGIALEKEIAAPGTTQQQFGQQASAVAQAKVNTIVTAMSAEACNQDVRKDPFCAFRGFINWPPYASCQ